MPLARFEECWPLLTESLPELALNLNIVFLVDCLSSGNPVDEDHVSAVKKRDHQKFVGGFALTGLLGSGRANMLPLGTLSLDLWVIAIDPAFIAGHQSIKNCVVRIDQLYHLPAVMTTSFFLIISEHPWDKPGANLPHLQFFAKDCVYSSHTDIKLCTIDTRRFISMKFFIWPINSVVLTSLLLPHLSSSLTDSLPSFKSLMPLKNWCSVHARWSKSSRKHSICFCGIFPSLKRNFIAYRSS